MKINIICNHIMAFSALEELAVKKLISGLAFSSAHPEYNHMLQQFCYRHNIRPTFINEKDVKVQLMDWLNRFPCDVAFVIGCKHKIPVEVLHIPRYGFLNFHPAPLPQYRGPDPVFWLLKNRETKGALCVHQMTEKLDDGDIVETIEIPVHPNDNHGIYTAKYSAMFSMIIKRILDKLNSKNLISTPQDNTKAKYYKKPEYTDLIIDFNKQTANEIAALTLACNSSYGGAYLNFKNGYIRANQITSLPETSDKEILSGTLLSVNGNRGLVIKCKKGAVRIDILTLTEGIFSGDRFANLVGLKAGDKF